VDYYKVLQVDPEAEEEVIKAAYKRLSEKYHPDRNRSPDATEKMVRINAAHAVLSDPERRRVYDVQRRAERKRRASAAKRSEPVPEPISPQPQPQPQPHWAQYAPAPAWKRPGHVNALAIVLKTLTGLAIFAAALAANAVARCSLRERKEARNEERTVAAFDVRGEFTRELASFSESCTRGVSPQRRELVTTYCACLVENMREKFDYSPLQATSIATAQWEYKQRVNKVTPVDADRERCVPRQAPRPPVFLGVPIEDAQQQPTPQRPKAPKPTRKRDPLDDLDPAVRDALAEPDG